MPEGRPVHVLFICTNNRMRSRTAEVLLSGVPGYAARSAGTAPTAERQVDAEILGWADVVVAMEKVHADELRRVFPDALRGKRLAVLGVPDAYPYMDTQLIVRLREELPDHLDLPPGW